ncbi:hypothetical protein [Pseudomonas sp. dw_358]|uniref:hypothetical protein n=1 Tax=Pseudomonas sp. dw_358 TaxID=2720083 RepID=UPI001BD416BC|nr:hypothetical protein [Pseudomonas sp. dw_358]
MRISLTSVFVALGLSTTAQADIGPDTASAMQAYYNATPEQCGKAPAFLCSGILLRTTRPSTEYHTWDHSPNTRKKGGVAFSYLRADTPIHALAEGASSGFTLTPRRHRAEGTMPYRVLCAYPTDGDTWTRDVFGCGDNAQTESVEQFCHEHGIHTAEAWIERYEQTEGPAHQRYFAQCAFDVRSSRGQAAVTDFYQSLRVMQLMPERPFPWNEMVIGAWDESRSNLLPIQSFFHVTGQWNGLRNAQFDQQDWFTTTGKFVPVIEITLPSDDQPARFTYHAGEQVVTVPE